MAKLHETICGQTSIFTTVETDVQAHSTQTITIQWGMSWHVYQNDPHATVASMCRTGAPEVSEFYASEAWPSLEPSLGNSGTYGELRPHGVRQLLERKAALKQMGVDCRHGSI